MLHILCIVGGFGALAYNGLYMSLAQRRTAGGTGAVLEVNKLVSGMAEILVYAALLFGIGAVTASHKTVKFSDPWIGAAFGVYLVTVGLLHGWIKPRQRSYAGVVDSLEKRQVSEGAEIEAQVASLKKLEKQVGFGWGAFNLLVIGAVYLMVFQPGS
jgi:protein-S-isoprenylcysteine O-methyltransferase Ste14